MISLPSAVDEWRWAISKPLLLIEADRKLIRDERALTERPGNQRDSAIVA
jgi:hypothetical protein